MNFREQGEGFIGLGMLRRNRRQTTMNLDNDAHGAQEL